MLKNLFALLVLILIVSSNLSGQTGCPGCEISLPVDLPEDTIYLSDAPVGQVGVYYEEDISFRMPKTTNTVPNTTPGLTINQININSVSNLPPGLNWEASQLNFVPAEETDGCVRFCGTPLQPGVYEVEVVVTALVFIITETTSFSFIMEILPSESITEGFTMTNNTGCGEIEVSFENNVPSEGAPGFSYSWNFGNGNQSIDEDPFDQTYSIPGTYEVNYQAIIDTFGYFLTEVTVEEVGCSDLFSGPDLQLEVYDADDNLIYQSDEISNVDPPYSFPLNLEILTGDYKIRVVDDDSGLEGGDTECGLINFNQLSNGQLADSDMTIDINIIHPVDTVNSVDTVEVFLQPEAPVIDWEAPQMLCEGEELELSSNYETGNQWYRDSIPVLDGDTSSIIVSNSGLYWVTYTSPEGCSASSESILVEFEDLPQEPEFFNEGNFLSLTDPTDFEGSYDWVWYIDGTLLDDISEPELCIDDSGEFLLEVIDLTSGCSNSFSSLEVYDPDFPGCISSREELEEVTGIRIFPNPTHRKIQLELELLTPKQVKVLVFNAIGQKIQESDLGEQLGSLRLPIDLQGNVPGVYFVSLFLENSVKTFSVVKK